MALTLPADAGEPMSAVLIANSKVKHHEFPALTRQISLRNTGTNTLWLSLDEGKSYFDVACGTSWDDRVSMRELWYCTQLGKTRFVVIGLSLMDIGGDGAGDNDSARRPAKPQLSRRWLPSRIGRDRR
jgi:hypothetical protein